MGQISGSIQIIALCCFVLQESAAKYLIPGWFERTNIHFCLCNLASFHSHIESQYKGKCAIRIFDEAGAGFPIVHENFTQKCRHANADFTQKCRHANAVRSEPSEV